MKLTMDELKALIASQPIPRDALARLGPADVGYVLGCFVGNPAVPTSEKSDLISAALDAVAAIEQKEIHASRLATATEAVSGEETTNVS